MSDSIGEKIRAARKDAHITQIQLAKRMGVTKQTVSLYENGGANPTTKMLAKFAAGLKVPVGLLVGDEEGQLTGQWVSIKTRLPEPDKEDEIFVPCLVNVILRSTIWMPTFQKLQVTSKRCLEICRRLSTTRSRAGGRCSARR